MKWMYLEQETKEAYLRAILCDPPTVIEQKDNDELGKIIHALGLMPQKHAMLQRKRSSRRKREKWMIYAQKYPNSSTRSPMVLPNSTELTKITPTYQISQPKHLEC
jgi:hypothetical protein